MVEESNDRYLLGGKQERPDILQTATETELSMSEQVMSSAQNDGVK